MSGFRPSTERPTVYPFNGKSENLQHDFSQGKQKQSGEPHEQSRGSRTGKDHQYGRPGYQKHYDETANLDFYQNKKRFEPNGIYIEELLTKWKDDYKRLEVNHSYIQWLFPLQKHGKNPKAKPLTDHEIELVPVIRVVESHLEQLAKEKQPVRNSDKENKEKKHLEGKSKEKAMKEDTTVMDRFLRAYELMLGFYGIKLQNKATGSVERNCNYLERFENLNNYTHNNLRITRILKCLALLGYEHFQAPLVKFFLEETLLYNNLKNVKSSATHHFLRAVKDDKERCDLKKYESSLKTSKESEIRNKRKEECRSGSVSSWPKQKSN